MSANFEIFCVEVSSGLLLRHGWAMVAHIFQDCTSTLRLTVQGFEQAMLSFRAFTTSLHEAMWCVMQKALTPHRLVATSV